MTNYSAVQVTYEEVEEIINNKIGCKDFVKNVDVKTYDFTEIEIEINLSEDNSDYVKDILDSLGLSSKKLVYYYNLKIILKINNIIKIMSKHISEDIKYYFIDEDYICFLY